MKRMFTLARCWLVAITLIAIAVFAAGLIFVSSINSHPTVALLEMLACLALFVAVCATGCDSQGASEWRWTFCVFASILAASAISVEAYLSGSLWVGIVIGFALLIVVFGILALVGVRFRELTEQIEEQNGTMRQFESENGNLKNQLSFLEPEATVRREFLAAQEKLGRLERLVGSWIAQAEEIARKNDSLDTTACALALVAEIKNTETEDQ
ncbi:MAG: hypothetical protein PHS27_02180 [Candidatus Pacebacteria bacterium]|nr:hypothetical protein [Candidatus Paceibacterota bacterium]